MWARMRRTAAGLVPAALASGFMLTTFVRMVVKPGAAVPGLFVVGALAGVVIVGLVRLFRVAPWAYPVCGFLCGPVPFLVAIRSNTPEGEGAVLWLFSSLLGLAVGLVEWARVRREG